MTVVSSVAVGGPDAERRFDAEGSSVDDIGRWRKRCLPVPLRVF